MTVCVGRVLMGTRVAFNIHFLREGLDCLVVVVVVDKLIPIVQGQNTQIHKESSYFPSHALYSYKMTHHNVNCKDA